MHEERNEYKSVIRVTIYQLRVQQMGKGSTRKKVETIVSRYKWTLS